MKQSVPIGDRPCAPPGRYEIGRYPVRKLDFCLAGLTRQHLELRLVTVKLQYLYFSLLIAVSTGGMKGLHALVRRVQRVGVSIGSEIGQKITLLLVFKLADAAQLFFENTVFLHERRMALQQGRDLLLRCVQAVDNFRDFHAYLGRRFHAQDCLSGGKTLLNAAEQRGDHGHVGHGKPPVAGDEIGVCHSATASASRHIQAGDA